MWQYDWPAWNERVKSSPGRWALERWFLMYLHQQEVIDALALEVKARLAAEGRVAQVRVESIWVDGTPQAEFSPVGYSSRNKKPQCELADLLLCVRWESPDGSLQCEKAMLIQAKVASKYNKLPGGKSTQKERLLFEECDRDKDITLYPGVNRTSPIGSYQLGSAASGSAQGLSDCASFLLMAKAPWPTTSVGPLQVGWPQDTTKTEINPHEDYLSAVINMVSGAALGLGREVKTGGSAARCVWTKMVNDLRGKYETIAMVGYNAQPRVTTSARSLPVAPLVHSLLEYHQSSRSNGVPSSDKNLLSPSFLPLLEQKAPEQLQFFQRMLAEVGPEDQYQRLSMMDLLGFFDQSAVDLWWDHSDQPPSLDTDFSDGSGPHLPILTVTLRADEQERRSD